MAYGEQVADLPWYLDRLDQPSLPLDYQYQPIGDGEGVDVYIVDSGINYQHYEFQHRAKYAGYDAVDNHYPQRKSQNGSDCHGHGTHVASLAGGVKYGSAKKANLFSVRVLDCNNRAPWSVVLDGLDYAARLIRDRKRPAVVSMSLGGNRQLAANAAVTYLTRLGVPVVVAAGNQGKNACDTSPAGAPTAITVAATCSNDCLYRATNLGSCVDIFAPGCNVEAAGHSCKNCTKVLSGTSMAAPLVAGVVAIHLQRQPFLTPNDILQRLTNSSSKNVICFEGVSNKLSEDTPNKLLQVPGECDVIMRVCCVHCILFLMLYHFPPPSGNCGGVYPERTMIAINHPSYPRPYLPLLKCQWKIEAEEGQQVEVDVSFQLERKYDFLLVCDSLNCEFESNDIIGKYTGEKH